MQQFVAIVNPTRIWTDFRSDMLAVLDTPGLTGVDVRWSLAGETGGVQRNINALQIIRAARDRGLEIRAHGWVGADAAIGPALASAQAQQVAQICDSEGIHAWGVNAEKDVWRHGQAAAVAFLDAYLDRFYAVNRKTHACYLGFVHPPIFYGKDTQIPAEHKLRYRQCWQMVYQLDAKSIQSRIDLGKREFPQHARNVYIGCGRIDSAGTTQGNFQFWLDKGRQQVDAITWYVGNERAPEQLAKGHAKHPALTVAIPKIAGLT